VTAIACDRCGTPRTWRFIECAEYGPIFLCADCIEFHRQEMAEEKAWEAHWNGLTPEERRRELALIDRHVTEREDENSA
jgi:hypothetical protein